LKQTKFDRQLEIARENIKLAASKQNLSLAEVSRRAGMSRNGVSQFVSGRTTLSYGNMLAVCEVLSMPIGIMHKPEAYLDRNIAAARFFEKLDQADVVRLLSRG
jgi:transcriptional regulator with XRE-family HTH domain